MNVTIHQEGNNDDVYSSDSTIANVVDLVWK